MRDRPRTTICREGWYFVALLGVVLGWALLREENLLILLAGMMLGPLWFNRRSVAKILSGLTVRRQVADSVHAGQPLAVCLQLLNTRRRGTCWAVEAKDSIRRIQVGAAADAASTENAKSDSSASGGKQGLFFTSIPPDGSQRQIYSAILPRRGCYELGPVKLSTRFPFGMFRRTAIEESTTKILVFPRLGELTQAWTFRHRAAIEGIHGSRRPGRAPGDFFGVRPWQSGDAVRWVHWRSTARRGNLVVRQFERPRRHDVALLVDLWQPADPRPADLEHVELAVSFAATLAADLCQRREGVLMLGIAAEQPSWQYGDASPALLHGSFERLAIAEACPRDELPNLCEAHLPSLRSATEIVVVTTRTELDHDLRTLQPLRLSQQGDAHHVRTVSTAAPEFRELFRESK